MNDVYDAESRLERFAPLLALLFPELEPAKGRIESPLCVADKFRNAMMRDCDNAGCWYIKADHKLPVAGSIKARGGVYEVLVHAERLALHGGLIGPADDLTRLRASEARDFFSHHQILVGSTGNLGLSVGIMAAALGFEAVVHMSVDAKEWKKARLRECSVKVIEHSGDYGAAVAAGRVQASKNPDSYFIDDENSACLFLGYAVAALRLKQQLAQVAVAVNEQHPLFVYLPCGVGGAPGGITFGLKHLFGDDVHCFFAEPTASPSMLVRLASDQTRSVRVEDFGLDNCTDADGLAVGQASDLVGQVIRPLVSGIFTVRDDQLFQDLYTLKRSQGMQIEPSAAAGLRGPQWVLKSQAGHRYLAQHNLLEKIQRATHLLWTTGGDLLPEKEYTRFVERGRIAFQSSR